MNLSLETPINSLLEAYPFLVGFLVAYNPKYRLLENKAMRATIGKMVTLKEVAGIGGISPDRLVADIAAEIERRTDD